MHCRDVVMFILPPCILIRSHLVARHSFNMRQQPTASFLLFVVITLALQWLIIKSHSKAITLYIEYMRYLQCSARIAKHLHGSNQYWPILIPFYHIGIARLHPKFPHITQLLPLLIPTPIPSEIHCNISALLYTLDDMLMWKYGHLTTGTGMMGIKIGCRDGQLFIGYGDVLITSDLMAAMKSKKIGIFGLLFGCLLLRQNISTHPIPALALLVPPIMASRLIYCVCNKTFHATTHHSYGHFRLPTFRKVDKKVFACLVKASRSCVDFLRALFSMKKMRPLPVKRS